MTEDAELRRKHCTYKVAYTTEEAVAYHAERMEEYYPGHSFNWYLCQYAPADKPHWHVGHKRAERTTYL